MSKKPLTLEIASKAKKVKTPGARWVNCTVTVNNKSAIDVSDGNVALQDSETGSTAGAYFGYIRAGSSDTRMVSLQGGFEIILVHFNGSDGSSWTGSGAASNATELILNLN